MFARGNNNFALLCSGEWSDVATAAFRAQMDADGTITREAFLEGRRRLKQTVAIGNHGAQAAKATSPRVVSL